MGITRVEVDEYTCELCGYKWINRVNGKDGPVPKRCAKCKHQHWEKGKLDPREKGYRDALKKRFGYFNYWNAMFQGGWRIEKNVKRYLERRPPIEEMKVILEPMCYLFEQRKLFEHSNLSEQSNLKLLYQERYKSYLLEQGGWSEDRLEKFKRQMEDMAVKNPTKTRDYQLQVSRQLLKNLMDERGIPYDEKEAKRQLLYRQYGKYAIPMIRLVPELCNALRKDLYPGLTDEQIRDNKEALERIKAKILKEQPEQLRLRYVVDSPEELIQSCWPDWLA